MKKHVLMFVAIGLMSLPLMANNQTEQSCLVDQLCEDEAFVALVTETEKIIEHLSTLNAEERKNFQSTESFTCYQESLMSQVTYLAKTYSLAGRADHESVMIAATTKVLGKKKVQKEECLVLAMVLFSACDSMYPNDPILWGGCIAAAWLAVDSCMGIPQA